MNRVLTDIAATFGVSKPVYVAQVSSRGDSIEFNLKDKYDPRSTIEEGTDPVYALVARYFRESFDRRRKCFVHDVRVQDAYAEIVNSIVEFNEKFSPLKNPRQSKLHKFLQSMNRGYNHPTSEGFIALYRYIHNNDLDSSYKGSQHVQNVLAILEMMKEKHEDKESSN